MSQPERAANELRPISFQCHYLDHPHGSVLVEMGRTRVICAATVRDTVPRWMREQNVPGGWITSEYSMLPASCANRKLRAAYTGKADARSVEIQRLIGRSLRALVDTEHIGRHTIYVDCDVINADGGTRCASICGGAVALQLALQALVDEGRLKRMPRTTMVAAVSVGIVNGECRLDLDYALDVNADVDMNVVMTEHDELVEVQGTGERTTFSRAQLGELLDLAATGSTEIIRQQYVALDREAAAE